MVVITDNNSIKGAFYLLLSMKYRSHQTDDRTIEHTKGCTTTARDDVDTESPADDDMTYYDMDDYARIPQTPESGEMISCPGCEATTTAASYPVNELSTKDDDFSGSVGNSKEHVTLDDHQTIPTLMVASVASQSRENQGVAIVTGSLSTGNHAARNESTTHVNASDYHMNFKPKANIRKRVAVNRRSQLANDTTVTPKLILVWNSFFQNVGLGVGVGTAPFADCPAKCYLSNDRSHLPECAAVIVHTFYSAKTISEADLPQRMSLEQIFVFLLMENPARSRKSLRKLNYMYVDVFNLTMTYLNDERTDLFTPYGSFIKRTEPDPELVPSVEELAKKTELAVWFVSNCQANSSRYEYVDELSKYVKVDVFGKCGEDVCPKGSGCMETIANDYIFYLALENGFCKDYVTEKAFGALLTSMVPVVHGGAAYTEILPPHSFIDVRDFASPQELAARLTHLAEHPEELQTYVAWKEHFDVKTTLACRQESLCKLCQILHGEGHPYKTGFDPLSYWRQEDCLMGNDERRAVHLIQ